MRYVLSLETSRPRMSVSARPMRRYTGCTESAVTCPCHSSPLPSALPITVGLKVGLLAKKAQNTLPSHEFTVSLQSPVAGLANLEQVRPPREVMQIKGQVVLFFDSLLRDALVLATGKKASHMSHRLRQRVQVAVGENIKYGQTRRTPADGDIHLIELEHVLRAEGSYCRHCIVFLFYP
jgi:hypothetical protein